MGILPICSRCGAQLPIPTGAWKRPGCTVEIECVACWTVQEALCYVSVEKFFCVHDYAKNVS